MNCIPSVETWLDIPSVNHNDYLLVQIKQNKNYIIFSDEENSIIYRDGYFEAGGNFVVYKLYNGIWSLDNEGFGSPTNLALYIGDLDCITKVNSKNDIIDLRTRDIVICKL